jgi:hypothetical protein
VGRARIQRRSKLTFDLEALRNQAALTPLPVEKQAQIFFVLLLGFGTLVSLFPFHSWAAPAYATAPTPVAMLHSGVLKKFGLYGLIRIALPLLPQGRSAVGAKRAAAHAVGQHPRHGPRHHSMRTASTTRSPTPASCTWATSSSASPPAVRSPLKARCC